MKFLAGVLLGLLLSGPAVHHHFTEVNRFQMPRQEEPRVIEFIESTSNPVPPVDGDEQCVIDLLGGSMAEFDANDIMNVLETAWLLFDGPCDMLETTGERSQ